MKLKTTTRFSTRALLAAAVLALCASLPTTAMAQMNKAATEAAESYFEFIDYNGGTIMAAQIPADDWKKFHRYGRCQTVVLL